MCWDWLRPDTVLFCVTSEQPEEETFCPAHFEEKHPNLPQWMTGNLSFTVDLKEDACWEI